MAFSMMLWWLIACGGAEPSDPTRSEGLPVPAVAPVSEVGGIAPTPPAEIVAARVDLHVDTPTQMVRRNVGLDDPALESGLDDMRAGGTNVVVEVLWPPREPANPAAWAAQVERLFSKVEAEDKRLDGVAMARTPTEARAILAAHQIAMLVAIEGAHGIEAGGVASLAGLHARGLSLIGLTWTFSNQFAGSSGDAPAGASAGTGLTADGRALVAAANALGVVIDVSHASDATTMEACALSSAPVIASHSDADGVRAHARNLSDDAIRCIAQKGGVIGLNFHAPFVGQPANVAKVADHADYLKKLGGAGVVALGSDYDGLITTPAGLTDAGDLESLWDELRRRGWSESDVRGAQGENFMRAWQTVIDRATR
jgi:membrane dipeptidase